MPFANDTGEFSAYSLLGLPGDKSSSSHYNTFYSEDGGEKVIHQWQWGRLHTFMVQIFQERELIDFIW